MLVAATHLSEVGNGLSWPKPQWTCNAVVTCQAQHSSKEGVLHLDLVPPTPVGALGDEISPLVTREYYSVIQHAQCC